jgi:predicted dehydrogenase
MKARVMVAGCGGMSREWLTYADRHRDQIEIVALVDRVLEAAKQRAEEFGLDVPQFASVEAALERVSADLLWDITLPEARESVVTAAISHGLDVFSEKPMADSWEAASRLARLAKKKGRRYVVMQNRRYHPQIRALKALVDQQLLGEVGIVTADFFLGPHFGGFREAMAEPLLLDMAIHTFDQARFLLGGGARRVYCHAFNPKGSWYQGHAAAIAIFEWEGGAVFEYRGSWAAEGVPTSWESDWRIVGSKGSARWDGAEPPYAEVRDSDHAPAFLYPTRRIEATVDAAQMGGHQAALAAMMKAWADKRPAETEAEDNLNSIAMVFAAIQSAQQGKRVAIPDDLS